MSSEQRKVLEDIQRAKRLLKEGAAVSLGMHTSSPTTAPLMTPSSPAFPTQSPAGIGDMMMSPGMRGAMQVLSQANITSFGYFIPQDSHFGNSIIPVLPRIDPPPVPVVTAAATTSQSTSATSSAAAQATGGSS